MRFHLQAREQQSYNIFRTSSLTETYLEHQAPAPVGVQRPAHAEVEAGGGVADVQPPQFPLRLKRATAKKNDAFRSPSVDKQILAPEERIVFLHHLELGRKLQHVCN